jgi:arsenite methyltransferase
MLPVCCNTFRMLAESRFSPHFSFLGDFSRHYGLFEGCGSVLPFDTGATQTAPAPAPTAATSATSGSCC